MSSQVERILLAAHEARILAARPHELVPDVSAAQRRRPGPRPRVTTDLQARVVELVESGLTHREVGELLGKSPRSVYRILRRTR